MTEDDLPRQITCVIGNRKHVLYLRSDEDPGEYIYATPRSKAINGEDPITVYIPKERH